MRARQRSVFVGNWSAIIDENVVEPAVIVPLELDHLWPRGVRPRNSHRCLDHLGTA